VITAMWPCRAAHCSGVVLLVPSNAPGSAPAASSRSISATSLPIEAMRSCSLASLAMALPPALMYTNTPRRCDDSAACACTHTAHHNQPPRLLPLAHNVPPPPPTTSRQRTGARRQIGRKRASHADWRTAAAAMPRWSCTPTRSGVNSPTRAPGDEIGPPSRAPVHQSTTRTRHPGVALTCWSWTSGRARRRCAGGAARRTGRGGSPGWRG
jgi:hypothetical protein